MCQLYEMRFFAASWSRLRPRILVLALLLPLLAQRSLAADTAFERSIEVDIPANISLEDALIRWGTEAGMVVMMNTSVVRDQVSHGVQGKLRARDALDLLLRNSGLSYTKEGDRIRIVPTSQALHTALRRDYSESSVSDAAAGPAAPDSASAESSSFAGAGPEITQVVVTAQKRTERIQDVPVPVSAISGAELEAGNKLRLEDYYADMPGLSLSPGVLGGAPNLAIRGLNTGGTGGIVNPTVGITVDDVPYGPSTGLAGGTSAPDFDPGDLARVEVLRGPQGTLYGASSIGGLLKYVTVDPSTEAFSGRVEGGGNWVANGTQTGFNVRGSVNVPLNDTLAMRASAFTRQDPGYIDDPVHHLDGINEGHADGGRLAALWLPSEVFSLKLSAMLQRNSTSGSPSSDPTLGDLKLDILPGSGGYNRWFQAYSAVAKAKLPGVDITLVSGYGVDRIFLSYDWTNPFGNPDYGTASIWPNLAGAPLTEEFHTKKYTEELRFSGSIGSRLDWMVAGFYSHEISHALAIQYAADLNTGAIGEVGYTDTYPTGYKEVAAFTDLTAHITDQFDIQVGARESHDRQSYWERAIGPLFYTPPDGIYYSPPIESSENAFTYLFTPEFKVSPDLMVYARLASGYRPGGPNAGASYYHVPPTVKPDKTQNYELGAKGNFFNGTLSFDTSLYYIDWKDIQITVTADNGGGYAVNGSRAKSQGLEQSMQWRPVRGLSISAWAVWSQAVITEASPANANPVLTVGERLPITARFSANLSIQDEFPLAPDTAGFVAADAAYVGNRVPNLGASGPAIYPAYTRTNLRSGVKYNTWTLTVFADNLANVRGLIGQGTGTGAATAVTYIQPRTVGLSLAKQF